MRETMVTGVRDNQQPDDLEAGEGVQVKTFGLLDVRNCTSDAGEPSCNAVHLKRVVYLRFKKASEACLCNKLYTRAHSCYRECLFFLSV